uniref:BHLH domain-containing protein n=1 Tax=Aegilops tauschii subsp. strangulata TaxID=200361 RepID=A0A453NWS9_AEGTS
VSAPTMDPQEDGFFYSHHGACHADSSQGTECKAQSSITARKVHKADCERMRRDKLNEQFMELGTTLAQQGKCV